MYKFILITLIALSVHTKVAAESINTAAIVQQTMACTDCMDWRVSGVCFWLKCTILGCDVETSVRVSHNIPDLVVSTYTTESPWSETASWNSNPNSTITHSGSENASHVDFKSADVIGNPAVLLFESLNSTGLFCTSQANPFQPYFLSSFDTLGWHKNLPEMLYAPVMNLTHRVGTWGPLYPRGGWTISPEDPKAAAITAVRAGHIVTRSFSTHVALSVTDGDSAHKSWPPGELGEDDGTTGQWQMLTPVAEQTSEVLGSQYRNWSTDKYIDIEQYSWALWRPYSCCEPKGSFLFSIEFE